MRYLWYAGFLLLLATPAGADWTIEDIPTPARPGSGQPNLFATTDAVYLSWQHAGTDGRATLRFSKLTGANPPAWTPAKDIAAGEDWFVNWADIPSLVAFDDSKRLAAHWLVRSGADTYAYDVHVAQSFDGGSTWTDAVTSHKDSTQTQHGFVSMLPLGTGVLAVWLDGRKTAGPHDAGEGPMSLRAAVVSGDGTVSGGMELDALTCSCCPTSAAATSGGVIVAYRDRSGEEVRDISVVRFADGSWTAPAVIAGDNWNIAGCPVNGPALDAAGEAVVVAWFTAPGNEPQVKTAFSSDGGKTFAAPVRIDGGSPVGRTDVVLLADGTAVVSWIENTDEGADIRIREITPAGAIGTPQTVAATSAKRSSGFPRMVRLGEYLYVAWVDVSGESLVKTARLRPNVEG